MNSRPFYFKLIAATLLLATQGLAIAQSDSSTAGNLAQLQSTYETLRDSFLGKVSQLPSSPENLSNGSLAAEAETLSGVGLKNLSDQIAQQRSILKQKSDSIDSSSISKADKIELHNALDAQRKPLDVLQQKTAALTEAVNQLKTSGLKSWKEVYDSYYSVSGAEKASAKLRGLTDAFCQPLLPPKPTPSASPDSSTAGGQSAAPRQRKNRRQQQDSLQVTETIPSTGASSPLAILAQAERNGQVVTPEMFSGSQTQAISPKILSFQDARQRADNGDAYAQAVVSIYYATGYMVQKDLAQAAKYAVLSAQQKNPLGLYRLGVLRESGEGGIAPNPQEGIALKAAAFQGLNNQMVGDPYAITALGVMCFRGEAGVNKNPAEAASLYKKAADLGYAPAQYCYSACLYNGQGVQRNPQLAEQYWRLACQQQYPPALKGKPLD